MRQAFAKLGIPQTIDARRRYRELIITTVGTRLNAMHAKSESMPSPIPWALTFSVGRAIQHPALEIWSGEEMRRGVAQAALLHRAQCNRAALQGEYGVAMELP